MSTHKEKARVIYKTMQAMVDNMVQNDNADEREKIADALKSAMSDYSWERYACGRDEENAHPTLK